MEKNIVVDEEIVKRIVKQIYRKEIFNERKDVKKNDSEMSAEAYRVIVTEVREGIEK